MLRSILNGNRPNTSANTEKARSQANELYYAGQAKSGTDEETFVNSNFYFEKTFPKSFCCFISHLYFVFSICKD